MTSYFESVLERHYQNFIFTYKMYAYSSKLVECLYHDALEEINTCSNFKSGLYL